MRARIRKPSGGPLLARSSTPLRWDRIELFESLSVAEPNSGCALWIGPVGRKGYGQFYTGYTSARAHRIAYERAFGPMPEGLCVCHRCDTPACVNPDHMFLGTIADNNHDMARKGRARGAPPDKRRRKAVCKRGHPMTGDNVRVIVKRDGKTVRQCLACVEFLRATEHASAEARKAARRAERLNTPRVCSLGHAIADDNVILDADGCRRCRLCRRAYYRERYLAKIGRNWGLFPANNPGGTGDFPAFGGQL